MHIRLGWLKQTVRDSFGNEVEGYELVQVTTPEISDLGYALEPGDEMPEPKMEPIYTERNGRLVLTERSGAIIVVGED